MTLTTKHQRLTALRPLSPESVASLAAAWDVRNHDQFPEVSKLIGPRQKGSGQNARATWRGHSARRQADQFRDLTKLIRRTLLP